MATEGQKSQPLDCELCIVGAGYAALNALNAAAKYLKKGARVVIVDKSSTWGGQWLHQYDFVRLHQPYRMFTAGDQPWTLDRDPSYLATRREVLDHFASVPGRSAGQLELHALFGHAYAGHHVREGRVELDALPMQGASAPVRIRAKRLLIGTGIDIAPLPAYPLSSTRVRSVAVSDPVLTSREFLDGRDPVYIIGSGKTAMDCARHLIQNRGARRREINVIAGSGMWFMVRDNIYPSGARRFVRGTVNADLFLTVAKLFDGQNEAEIMEHLRRRGCTHTVWGVAGNCRIGLMSLAEKAELRAGVDHVFHGHLVDVDGTRMTMRQGDVLQEHNVPAGSYFINCTTHLRGGPHQPVLRDSGLVCAPQFALGLTGMSAYFLTHLWFRDQLSAIAPLLYRFDVDVKPKLRFTPHLGLMIMANMLMVSPRLPPSIAGKYEGDFNRWYPLYRRVPMLARLSANRGMLLDKAERFVKLRFSDTSEFVPALSRPVTSLASDSVYA